MSIKSKGTKEQAMGKGAEFPRACPSVCLYFLTFICMLRKWPCLPEVDDVYNCWNRHYWRHKVSYTVWLFHHVIC